MIIRSILLIAHRIFRSHRYHGNHRKDWLKPIDGTTLDGDGAGNGGDDGCEDLKDLLNSRPFHFHISHR